MGKWDWIWPHVGATPISEGLDSEMFDRTDYPYSDTFVREAIQNSLDARLDTTAPVVISFQFHEERLGTQRDFLDDVFRFRKEAGLSVPGAWNRGAISWITIEDFNARGLGGSLTNRMSDFWNYWLNFGISNKDGSGRGGRGIGRVTFLIASQIRTVFGLTRRYADGQLAACGMAILRAFPDGNNLRSTHAYLAKSINGSIYELYATDEFRAGLKGAFEFQGYPGPAGATGLALAIPYPHEELKPEGILASAIEHFAPAIMNRSLVVKVDGTTLDETTIADVALAIADHVRLDAVKNDVGRYLGLIRAGFGGNPAIVSVTDLKSGISALKDSPAVKKLQAAALAGEHVALKIELPLEKNGRTIPVSLRAVLRRIPPGNSAIDRLFREGMSLPEVKTKNPGELDLIVLVEDRELATYLNFCEGKAHLDLLESKDVRAKLEEKGYTGYLVKRFVKGLPVELRNLLTPDILEPDASVFDDFFAVDDDTPGREPGTRSGPDVPPPPPPPPPQPKVPILLVETLDDGFRAKANPKFKGWPVNVSIAMAYADGSRRPEWSKYDFTPNDLSWSGTDCTVSITNNRLQALKCGPGCLIEVTGFDAQRELDTRIRVWKDAQEN